jgi:hypothetical protein
MLDVTSFLILFLSGVIEWVEENKDEVIQKVSSNFPGLCLPKVGR